MNTKRITALTSLSGVRLAGAAFVILAASAGATLAAESKTAAAPAASTAPSVVSTEPQNTSATYGDWVLRCSRGDGTQAQRVCEVVQSFQIQGQQGLFAQMAIGRIDAKSPLKITVVMQPNVSFPSDIKLGVDEKDSTPVVLSWMRCLPGGCFADADLKDDQIKRWKNQTGNGNLAFRDGAGRDIPLPFSFRGLSQALEALSKTS
jgi:invasion protein IalB